MPRRGDHQPSCYVGPISHAFCYPQIGSIFVHFEAGGAARRGALIEIERAWSASSRVPGIACSTGCASTGAARASGVACAGPRSLEARRASYRPATSLVPARRRAPDPISRDAVTLLLTAGLLAGAGAGINGKYFSMSIAISE